MLQRISMLTALLVTTILLPVHAEDPPALDKVIADLAAVGPEALLARVKELKAQSVALNKEATDLRTKADQLDAQSTALKQQIAAVEKFTTELAKAMAPPAPAPAPPCGLLSRRELSLSRMCKGKREASVWLSDVCVHCCAHLCLCMAFVASPPTYLH